MKIRQKAEDAYANHAMESGKAKLFVYAVLARWDDRTLAEALRSIEQDELADQLRPKPNLV